MRSNFLSVIASTSFFYDDVDFSKIPAREFLSTFVLGDVVL